MKLGRKETVKQFDEGRKYKITFPHTDSLKSNIGYICTDSDRTISMENQYIRIEDCGKTIEVVSAEPGGIYIDEYKYSEGLIRYVTVTDVTISTKGTINIMLDKIKETATSVKTKVKPYEKYLWAAALLLLIDHFILKGQITSQIMELARRLTNKLFAILSGFIDSLEGKIGSDTPTVDASAADVATDDETETTAGGSTNEPIQEDAKKSE